MKLSRLLSGFLILLMLAGVAWSDTKTINDLTAAGEEATGDFLHLWDTSAGGAKKVPLYQLGGLFYSADSSETDHGVASTDGNKTIYDFVTAAGTEHATILLTNFNATNTDYRFQTSETLPANITLMIQRGARLDPDSGITVTVNSPSHIDAVETQEIKTGDGLLAWTIGGVVPVEWYGGAGDDSTDNSTAMNAVLTALGSASGQGVIDFPTTGIYRITSQVTQTSGYIHWRGRGHGTQIHSYIESAVPAIYIDNSSNILYNVSISDLKFLGGDDNGTGTETVLIQMVYCRDAVVQRNFIGSSYGHGLRVERAQNFRITQNEIRGNRGWGIMQEQDANGNHGQSLVITDNTIQNNGTGIAGTGGIRSTGAENTIAHNVIAGHSNHFDDVAVYVLGDNTGVVNNAQFENNFEDVWLGANASDAAGDTTSGSQVIAGMSDTSLFHIGDVVTLSDGFAVATSEVTAKTSTSLTVEDTADDNVNNITVSIGTDADNCVVANNSLSMSSAEVLAATDEVSFTNGTSIIESLGEGFDTTKAEQYQYIIISGSTSNDGPQKISSITASQIQVDTTFTPPEALVDESTGQTVTIYQADVGVRIMEGAGNKIVGNHFTNNGQVNVLGEENNFFNYYYDNSHAGGKMWIAAAHANWTEGKFIVRGTNKSTKMVDTFADGDTTPTVHLGLGTYYTANTGSTSITEFDHLYPGQEFLLVPGDAITTLTDGTLLKVASGTTVLSNGSPVLIRARGRDSATLTPIAYVFFFE